MDKDEKPAVVSGTDEREARRNAFERVQEDWDVEWDSFEDGWQACADWMRSLAPAQAEPWQPIETAPKDGTQVISFHPDLGVCAPAWWCDDKWSRKPRPYWTNDKEGHLGIRWLRERQPTHWMPLHAAPLAEASQPSPPTDQPLSMSMFASKADCDAAMAAQAPTAAQAAEQAIADALDVGTGGYQLEADEDGNIAAKHLDMLAAQPSTQAAEPAPFSQEWLDARAQAGQGFIVAQPLRAAQHPQPSTQAAPTAEVERLKEECFTHAGYDGNPNLLRAAIEELAAIASAAAAPQAVPSADHLGLMASVTAILDGDDSGVGVCNEPWEGVRRRLLELVKRQSADAVDALPAKGDYVLATKWSDGDPGDPWCLGYYSGAEELHPGCVRHFVVDNEGKQIRRNGYRRVGRVTKEVGNWLLKHAAQVLELSPPGTVNLWTMLTDAARQTPQEGQEGGNA